MPAERGAHCSDSELLAYLDGELAWWRRIRVRRHLQLCWKCRSRANDQQEQIFDLAARLEAWEYPGSFWQLDQQLKLGRSLRRYEALNGRSAAGPTELRWLIAAGAAAALLLAILFWQPRTQRATISDEPVRTLAAARTFERQLYQRSVEQTLAVEMHPVRMPQTAASRLEIWSDAAAGRFASRWTAPDGRLKQALWRPAPGREYLFRPGASDALLHQEEHTGSDQIADFVVSGLSGGLEDAFMRWMESRPWTPVSFAREAAEWMNDAEAQPRAEPFTANDGSREVRIVVERHTHGGLARLTADFNAATFQPQSMSIRFEAGGKAAELKMIAQRLHRVPPAEVTAAADSMAEVPVAPSPSLSARHIPLRPAPVPPADTAPIDAARRAAEAQFVLHTAGACLGEPVVMEEVPGGVRVRNLRGSVRPEATSSSVNLRDVLEALADLRDELGVASHAQDLTGPPLAIAHARALKALGQSFPPRFTAALTDQSRRILERMVQDHVDGLRAALGDVPAPTVGQPMLAPRDWREAGQLLYDTLSMPRGASGAVTAVSAAGLLQALAASFSSETRTSLERARGTQGRE